MTVLFRETFGSEKKVRMSRKFHVKRLKEAWKRVKVTGAQHGCIPQNFSTYWKEVKWGIMNTENSGEEAGNRVRETAHTTL